MDTKDTRNDSAKEMNNEMNREARIEKLASMIKGIKVAMLTTIDPDGVLRARPMATLDSEFDGRLWFITKLSSGKVSSIRRDQHVNIAFADTDGNRFVSIAGRAQLVTDRKAIEEKWSPVMKAWFPEGVNDRDAVLLCIDADSAEFWDAPAGKLVELVGLAKSIVTGQSMDESYTPKRLDLTH